MKTLRSSAVLVATLLAFAPIKTFGQAESYHQAKRQQHYHDARHHTKAKIVGGSAAAGAVAGGLLGGGKGALIGAGAGAGAGLIANHAHDQHEIHKREQYGTTHPQ